MVLFVIHMCYDGLVGISLTLKYQSSPDFADKQAYRNMKSADLKFHKQISFPDRQNTRFHFLTTNAYMIRII